MEIRALSGADTEAFRTIRRESLENSPRSFAESLAEHDALSPRQFAKRLASSFSNDNFIIGAFRSSDNPADAAPLLAGVAGFVRNLPDGTVELVAEGPAEQVQALLEDVARRMSGYVERATAEDGAVVGYRDFVIQR